MDRRPTRLLATLLAGLVIAAGAVGCGEEEPELDVPEGEPLELGEVEFDVQISRFLNPSTPEDASYLEGAPPLEPGHQWFGVFMEIQNDGDEATVVPYPMKIVDTRGNVFVQERIENPFTLIPGTPIPPEEMVPGPDTPAGSGPIEGSMVLFSLEEGATEDRPLKLEVPGPDGVGEIELDL